MGADLTIVVNNEYFRDSYNMTNILWRLGLHYWGLEQEIPDLGKIKRVMTLKQVKILKLEVENRKPALDSFLDGLTELWLAANHCEAGVDGWRGFWSEKYAKLIAFLDHAIELKSGIRWSV